MAQILINTGTTAGDGTGTPHRTAFQSINSMMTETYANVSANTANIATNTSDIAALGGGGVRALVGKIIVPVTAPTDTSENILATVVIPAGLMGTSGMLIVTFRVQECTGTGTKACRIRLGGAGGDIVGIQTIPSSVVGNMMTVHIWNLSSTSVQAGAATSTTSGSIGAASAANTAGTQNTVGALDLVMTLQKSTGADVAKLGFIIVEFVA